MESCSLDALVATSPVNIRYFSGYHLWADTQVKTYMVQPGADSDLAMPGYAVFPLDGEPALTLPPVLAANAADLWVKDIYGFGDSAPQDDLPPPLPIPDNYQRFHDLLYSPKVSSSPTDALLKILESSGLTDGRIGIEFEGLPAKTIEEIRAALPGATLLDCSNLIRLVRMVKSDEEIRRLARSAEISEQAAMKAFEMAKPGVSLQDLNQCFRRCVAEEGADFDHFAIGPRGLGLVTEPNYVLMEDDVLFSDYGCVYQGYFSDTGTTLAMCGMSDPLNRRHEALHECFTAGMEVIEPGVKASTVREAMWKKLNDCGFTDSNPHGHGIGLETRDYPILVSDNGLRIKDDCVDIPSDIPLEENMVINLEAPMFVPGVGSIQIEYTLIVTSEGCRPLFPHNREQPYMSE